MDAPLPDETPRPRAAEFVRTFKTDAAALQSGTAPDFTNAGSSQASLDALSAIPAPEVLPLKHEDAAESVVNLDSISPAPLIASLTQAPPPPPPPEVAPLHTYKSDFADEVKEKQASQADIIAAEEDARPAPTIVPVRRKTDSLVLLSILLIFIGIAAAGGAYYWHLTHPTTTEPAAQITAPIFVDERQEIAGQGSALAQAIAASAATPPAENAVRLLYTADSQATTSIWNALALNAPDILERNIAPTGSMAGIVNAGTASPFFILAVTSYSDTLSGMLYFEPTMASALAALYPSYPAAAATSTATSTPATASSTPAAPAFRDETVENHDLRALVDSNNRTLLLYGYFNQQTLIIARDEAAFAAILDRLTNSHTST